MTRHLTITLGWALALTAASPNSSADEPLPDGAIARLGSGSFRYMWPTCGPAYSPDGRLIADITFKGVLYIWDARTGARRLRTKLHDGKFPDARLAFNADGSRLGVLAALDYHLIDTTGGQPPRRVTFDQRANCVALSPDLTTLVRGKRADADTVLDIHRADTGEKLRELPVTNAEGNPAEPSRIVFAPDGRSVFVADLGTSLNSPTIGRYDLATGRRLAVFESKLRNVASIAVSPDGNYLAVKCWQSRPVEYLRLDLAVTVQDLRTKEPPLVLVEVETGPTGDALAFSPDGRMLAAGFERDVRVYEVATAKESLRLDIPWCLAMSFHPAGTTLAMSGRSLLVQWDLRPNAPLAASADPPEQMIVGRFVAGGKELLTFGDRARWWDPLTGRLLREVELPEDAQFWFCMSISQDGTLAAISDGVDRISLVDLRTGKTVHRILDGGKPSTTRTCFSADGRLLFRVRGDDPRVLAWDTATGRRVREFKGEAISFQVLAVSPDGKWLATVSWYSPNEADRDIHIWDVATGRLARRIAAGAGRVWGLTFSPDGRTLASSGGEYGDGPAAVRLWDVATGRQLATFTGQVEGVGLVEFSPDGRTLVTAGDDLTFRLWEVASGLERHRITGHEGELLSVEFSLDGRLLAASSSDAPVFVWDVYGADTSGENPAQLWRQLADPDAGKAFAAIRQLIARPDDAAKLFEAELHPVTPADVNSLVELLTQLDSPRFAVRERAAAELRRHGDALTDWLREQAESAKSPEVRRRLEDLLADAEAMTPERLRQIRALEALGQIRTPAAKHLLTRLASGAPSARLTREARASLGRSSE